VGYGYCIENPTAATSDNAQFPAIKSTEYESYPAFLSGVLGNTLLGSGAAYGDDYLQDTLDFGAFDAMPRPETAACVTHEFGLLGSASATVAGSATDMGPQADSFIAAAEPIQTESR